jgi:RNA polymerase sigma-70 factor (ECF subfamily)
MSGHIEPLKGLVMDDRQPRRLEEFADLNLQNLRKARKLNGNLFDLPASKSMSSLSGAHYEADFPQAQPDSASGLPRHSELFRLAQSGDRSAFGQIVLLFQDRLYNAILRMVGDSDEARELTQETFTRALVKIDSFRGEAQPYTWLFRIAVNLSISQLRKVQRRRTFSLDQPSKGGNGSAAAPENDDQASSLLGRLVEQRTEAPPEAMERQERSEQVLAAMGRLDAEYRAVLVMRDVEGFDYQQMAEVLALPLGTLKSRLFRARLALRDELREYMK